MIFASGVTVALIVVPRPVQHRALHNSKHDLVPLREVDLKSAGSRLELEKSW
jgi:hypothetical protein